MAKRRRRRIATGILLGVSVLALFAMIAALGLLRNLPESQRARILLGSSLAMLMSFTGINLLDWERRRMQAQVWRRALANWEARSRAGIPPSDPLPERLTSEALGQCALRLYRSLGFRLVWRVCSPGGDPLYQMRNPAGEIEAIQCIQRDSPVGLGEVLDLYERISQGEIQRAAIWAPGGFTRQAVLWARGKPILLADRQEIGRLADSAAEAASEADR